VSSYGLCVVFIEGESMAKNWFEKAVDVVLRRRPSDKGFTELIDADDVGFADVFNSPKPLAYEAVTANCGNDTIGKNAAKALASRVNESSLDAMVINCQETDFRKTPKHLQKALEKAGLGNDYTVTCLGKMATHTKLGTQFHSNTGIASYVIHKKDLAIEVSSTIPVRREEKRGGSGYNKGGLVTEFSMTPKGGQAVRLQTTSGHLDSTKSAERSQDWYNLQKAAAKASVNNFKALDDITPSIKLGGYDVNTRNKFNGADENPTEIWEQEDTPQELMSLKHASPGGNRFSLKSTYKTSKVDIDRVEDEKRPGSTRGGMMDLVDIASDNMSNSDPGIINDHTVTAIGSGKKVDPKTERDHDVIISPKQTYAPPESRFDAIKNQMALQLDSAAPELAQQIRDLKSTPENEKQLVETHNAYLSKDGLLMKQMELQTRGLACAKKLAKINPEQDKNLEGAMFVKEPWLDSPGESISDKAGLISQNQANQAVLLGQLEKCKTPEDIKDFSSKNTIQQSPAKPPKPSKWSPEALNKSILDGAIKKYSVAKMLAKEAWKNNFSRTNLREEAGKTNIRDDNAKPVGKVKPSDDVDFSDVFNPLQPTPQKPPKPVPTATAVPVAVSATSSDSSLPTAVASAVSKQPIAEVVNTAAMLSQSGAPSETDQSTYSSISTSPMPASTLSATDAALDAVEKSDGLIDHDPVSSSKDVAECSDDKITPENKTLPSQ